MNDQAEDRVREMPAMKPTLTCPICGKVGVLDDDQFHGRVSTECFNEECSYHETVDWAKVLEEEWGITIP